MKLLLYLFISIAILQLSCGFSKKKPILETDTDLIEDQNYDEDVVDEPLSTDADGCHISETMECCLGETKSEECGLNDNGLQYFQCNDEGRWEKHEACKDHDQCVNGEKTEQICGFNDRGVQPIECLEGQWETVDKCSDSDVCFDDVSEKIGCGETGRGDRIRTCINGDWVEDSFCFCGDLGYESYSDKCYFVVGVGIEQLIYDNINLMRGLGGSINGEGERFFIKIDGTFSVVRTLLWRDSEDENDVTASIYSVSTQGERTLIAQSYIKYNTIPIYGGGPSAIYPTFFEFEENIHVSQGEVIDILFSHVLNVLVSGIAMEDIFEDGAAVIDNNIKEDYDFLTSFFMVRD